MQTTYYLLKHPEMLLDALDDPELALVEFSPDRLDFEDMGFLDHPENVALIEEFHRRLQERFEVAFWPNDWNIMLWVKKGQARPSAAVSRDRDCGSDPECSGRNSTG